MLFFCDAANILHIQFFFLKSIKILLRHVFPTSARTPLVWKSGRFMNLNQARLGFFNYIEGTFFSFSFQLERRLRSHSGGLSHVFIRVYLCSWAVKSALRCSAKDLVAPSGETADCKQKKQTNIHLNHHFPATSYTLDLKDHISHEALCFLLQRGCRFSPLNGKFTPKKTPDIDCLARRKELRVEVLSIGRLRRRLERTTWRWWWWRTGGMMWTLVQLDVEVRGQRWEVMGGRGRQ